MTTYIESKLNPDGTYDHSEVIQAHKNGADVDFFDDRCLCWRRLGFPSLFETVKYRAVIEEKTTHVGSAFPYVTGKQYSEDIESLTRIVIKYQDRLRRVEGFIQDKFQSGNTIPVERITLTRAEVNEVFPGLLK